MPTSVRQDPMRTGRHEEKCGRSSKGCTSTSFSLFLVDHVTYGPFFRRRRSSCTYLVSTHVRSPGVFTFRLSNSALVTNQEGAETLTHLHTRMYLFKHRISEISTGWVKYVDNPYAFHVSIHSYEEYDIWTLGGVPTLNDTPHFLLFFIIYMTKTTKIVDFHDDNPQND